MSSTEINKGINTLTHEFDHVCRKLQTTMSRHTAVGIGSCKIIKNINIFPYQEINCHKMSHSTTNPTKWHMHPAKTQISPVLSESSLSAWRNIGSLATLIKRTAKTLIRLGECPGWSESSLGAQVILLVCHVAAQMTSLSRFLKVWGHNIIPPPPQFLCGGV